MMLPHPGDFARGAVSRTVRLTMLAVAWVASPAALARSATPPATATVRATELEALQIQPDMYMIAGAGGNITVDIGNDGVVVVDTGSADRVQEVLRLIKKLTGRPIRYIINTSAEPEHVGGNATLSRAGEPILPAGYARIGLSGRDFAPILAEQHVQDRMSGGADPKSPQEAWPTTTYAADLGETQRKLFLNGQGIEVMYQKAAASDGDSFVHFRRSDVLVTGDILDTTRFPRFDAAKGGSIQGLLDSLNRILDLSISSTPFPYQEGGTLIVPGHGRLCTPEDVVEYRDMITIIRDRVLDGVKKGLTLAQVQQSNPTDGYRGRYGSDTGPWTTRMFVEAIYKELFKQKETPSSKGETQP